VIFPEVAEQLGSPRVLGIMRIKNEAEWIQHSLESQLGYAGWEGSGICDKVLVLDDHSTDETRTICRSFGENRVVLFESPFQGIDEGRDKNLLLQYAIMANPEWVVCIDGDEVLERAAVATLKSEFASPQVCAYAPRVLYFWDSLETVRVDGVYANFRRFSAFRVRGQNTSALLFPATGKAGFHCGNAPQGLTGQWLSSAANIKHYGYVDRDQRQRKFEWYNKIDPNNESEDCYRHIIETPGARHAPGPTVLVKHTEP
jgi:glycosyltransferase involved in cell wall biosynthesis